MNGAAGNSRLLNLIPSKDNNIICICSTNLIIRIRTRNGQGRNP